MKVIVNILDDKVVGLHYFGPAADEVVGGFAVAMKLGMTKSDLDSTIGIHPSTSEDLFNLDATKRNGVEFRKTECWSWASWTQLLRKWSIWSIADISVVVLLKNLFVLQYVCSKKRNFLRRSVPASLKTWFLLMRKRSWLMNQDFTVGYSLKIDNSKWSIRVKTFAYCEATLNTD